MMMKGGVMKQRRLFFVFIGLLFLIVACSQGESPLSAAVWDTSLWGQAKWQ